MRDSDGELPYVATWGFDPEFVARANLHVGRSAACPCVLIVNGAVDRKEPWSTPSGNFYARSGEMVLRALANPCRSDPACGCRYGAPESLLMVPLHSVGRSVGLVHVASPQRDAFDQRTVEYLERLAVEIGAAVENVNVTRARDEMNKRLTTTTDRIASCIDLVRRTQRFDHRIENPHLLRCWAASECQDRDCPAYGSEDLRCWLVEGTRCRESHLAGADLDGDACVRCNVYKRARPDRYSEITENFNSMLVALKGKSDRVMWLERKMIGSEKLSALGELVSGVAHELNNPLAVVLGFAQALLADPHCPSRFKADLGQINDAADRCRRIVTNLLDFSRSHEPDQQACDVNEVARRAVDMLAHAFRDGGLEVVLDLARDLPSTFTDPHQLERVFFNIAHNAHQALMTVSGDRAAPRRLVVRSSQLGDGQWLRVQFEDNGPGMPERHLRRVFEPFFTTKPIGQGTGLGLSIAYGIVKSLGGRLHVQSEVGRGTTLTVDLPFRATTERSRANEEADDDEDLTGLHILVVDDEDSIREVVERILEMLGADVDAACDGEHGVEAIRDTNYDCVLLDVRMAGDLDGFATYELMRDARPGMARNVVFMSGDTMNPRLQDFATRTGCGIVAKPFTLPALVREVRRAASAAAP